MNRYELVRDEVNEIFRSVSLEKDFRLTSIELQDVLSKKFSFFIKVKDAEIKEPNSIRFEIFINEFNETKILIAEMTNNYYGKR